MRIVPFSGHVFYAILILVCKQVSENREPQFRRPIIHFDESTGVVLPTAPDEVANASANLSGKIPVLR